MPEARLVLSGLGAAALPSLGGLAVQGLAYREPGLLKWWAGQKKPSWALREPYAQLALDVLCPAAFGLGSHLVVQAAPEDSTLPLCLYGSSLVSASSAVVALSRSRHLPTTAALFGVGTVFGGLAAVLFAKADPVAGALAIPWTLWLLHSTALFSSMARGEVKLPYQELDSQED